MERETGVSLVTLWMILVLLILPFSWISANMEGDALHNLRINLRDPNNVLQSWDPTLVNPCTWFHVTCNNDNSVIRVDLGNAALSGQLVPQVGQLKNLQYLELYGNNISGTIPSDLGNLTNLVSLDLYLNSFSGPIPNTLGKLMKLRFLRLNNNSLSGSIPLSLINITALQVLDLSNNRLSGPVPDNGSFSLFTPISFANNLNLCGPVTGKPCPGSPPFAPPPPFVPPSTDSYPGEGNPTGAIAGGVAAGAALLFAAPAIWFAYWRRRRPPELFFDVPAEEDPEVHLGQLKRFSLRELLVATDSFSNKNILGRGGFGKVYKGRLADGTLVAVKRLKEERTPGGELQFQTEVEMISMAVHRNLLRLRGFCMTPTERLLVYPYMANGSVASCLRERPTSEAPLDWSSRKRIALGSARGLSYLHDHCDPKIIHRDVKAANILLDEEFEAVVGDFGLAKLMDYKDTHVTTAVRGTIGHIAPEYLSTGKSSEKTDVFGMLPIGWLTNPGSNRGPHRLSNLNLDEQRTQMTLWAMARSPIMFGGDVRRLDETTSSLITNPFILEINSFSTNNMEFPFVTGTKVSSNMTTNHSQRSGRGLKEVGTSHTQFVGFTSCNHPKVDGWSVKALDQYVDQICWKESMRSHEPLCLYKRKPLLPSDDGRLIYNQGGFHLFASDGMEFCLDASPRKKRASKEFTSGSFFRCRSDVSQMWDLNSNGSLISSYFGLCATVKSIDANVDNSGVRSWIATGRKGEIYVALFNLNSEKTVISATISDLTKALPGRSLNAASCPGTEVWSGKDFGEIKDSISMEVEMHGCALFVLNCP